MTSQIMKNGKRQIACHKLIYATAVEMAGALYDEMMKDNFWWEQWKGKCQGLSRAGMQRKFIKQNLPAMIPQARATLAGMLSRPIDIGMKDEIMEALVLDNGLRQGRN